MKYVPGPLAGQLSGSLGNTTASHNGFGTYFRARTIPINPNTPGQQVQRNNLGELSQAYRNLTAARRLAWEALGLQMVRVDSLGVSYTLTGEQAFISVNRNRRLLTQADLLDAPILSSGSLLTTFSGTYTIGIPGLDVTFTPTPLDGDEFLIVEATRPVSPGRSSLPRSDYKIVFLGAGADASPQDLTTAYQALYGVPPIGSKIFLRARIINEASFSGVPLHTSLIVA